MIGWIKNLLKDSMVYGIGFGVSRFLQIIVLPIIARSLSLAEFGYYSNYVIFYTIAAGFFILGLDSSVARYYYDSEDESYRSKVFSSAFFTVLFVSILAVLLFGFFPSQLLPLVGVPGEYKTAFFYVLLSIPALTLNNFFLSWFKWKRQKIYFLINSIGGVVFLLIPLLIFRPLNFLLLFKIICFSQLIVAVISCFLASAYIKFNISRSLLVAMLKYGFPWMLVFVLGISRSYLDRIFLTRYLTDDNYGIYNFSARLSTLLSLIITAFDMSFGPLAFSIWNKPGAKEFFARLQSSYTFFISTAACAITILSPLLISLLGGEKYAGAEMVLPVLFFSAIPLSLINFSALGTAYAKKSFYSTISLFAGFAVVLLLNMLLTPVYYQYGAVWASLIGHLVILISGYYFSKKYYEISFHYLKDGLIFLLLLVLSVACVYWTFYENPWQDMIVKLIILLLLSAILLRSFFYKELQKALSFLRKKQLQKIMM